MARPVSRVLGGFALLAGLLAVALLLFTLKQPPPPALPSPNGYDYFLKAGTMLVGDVSSPRELGETELRRLVTNNLAALDLVRTGLTFKCQVPLDFSPTDEPIREGARPFSAHLKYLSGLKGLAQALAAEGKLAELEHRPGDAARSYLEVIQLGIKSGQGGTIIDSMVGMAVQSIGQSRLTLLLPSLKAGTCREIASALENAESQAEPAAVILRHDWEWGRRNYGWRGQLTLLLNYKSHRATALGWQGRFNSQHARTRVLMIELAARAYELEKGTRPKTLEQLVPGHLKAIPQDPNTGTNMVYGP